LGKSFYPLPIYFDVEFGYNLRSASQTFTFNEVYGTGNSHKPGTLDGLLRHPVLFSPEVAVHGELGLTLVRWHYADRLQLVINVDYRGTTSRSPGGPSDFELF